MTKDQPPSSRRANAYNLLRTGPCVRHIYSCRWSAASCPEKVAFIAKKYKFPQTESTQPHATTKSSF